MKIVWHVVSRTLYVLLFCLIFQQTIMAQLKADFTVSPLSGCAPVYINFFDVSSGNPTSWKWDLGNGTISFLQNPSATYFNPGKYTVKLVVKNAANTDSTIKINYITINALPKPQFIASDTTGCYPLKVSFTDQSNAAEGSIIKWEWDFGDGTLSTLQNPLHIYTSPGSYNVILRVTNTSGCVSTLSKAQYIQIKDGVNADFSYAGSSQCTPPSIITFTNTSTGTGTLSYQWLFGDGTSSVLQNPNHTYNTAGLYSIELILKNNAGCVDTLIKKDSVAVGEATANFTAPDSICQSVPFQLFSTSQPAASISWNFGNDSSSIVSNPVVHYDSAGTYNISMIANFGSCKDSVSKTIKILPKAAAAFTAATTTSCNAPFTVHFNNLNTGATSYKWFFGDNTTTVSQNPIHTYQQTGTYNVTLITTNSNGCSDTLQQVNYITIAPADIEINGLPLKGCAPIVFSPTYTVKSTVPIASYLWNFGDGTSSTGNNPTHVYAVPGVYTVSLTYTTTDGCTNTINYANAVQAGKKPAAAFTATPTISCASTPILFTDTTAANITSWLWNFGDGITDTVKDPVHYYADTGYFPITLIVSNNGCSDTLKKPAYIYINPPIAKFAVGVNCVNPYHFVFTNYSIGATTWAWDFGDGTASSVKNPIHDYTQQGNYTVRLTVTNGMCTNIAGYSARIVIEKADFMASSTTVCRGDSVLLQPVGFNEANIIGYKWTLGTIGSDTAQNVKVAYNTSGTYTISLVIINVNGCTDTMTKVNYIIVNGPTANFGNINNSACLKSGGTIQFTDASANDGTHPIKKWSWDFGDGNTQGYSSAPFAHTYATTGNYTVGLKVTDTYGCSDSISKANQIFIADPKAIFSSNDTMSCENRPINFINASTGDALNYLWSFGDAATSVQQSPVHDYATVGIYDAWLKITDRFGCTDSIFKPAYIRIDDPKSAFLISDSASTCPPLVVNFTDKSQYYKSFSWDFGDGTAAVVDNPVHYYNYPGSFSAKLIVTSPGGCTDTSFKTITIKGPTGSFVYDKTVSCNPGTVSFTAQTHNTQSFIWDFNDGGTLSTTDSMASHLYTSPGIYLPKMILQDAKGCKVPFAGKDTIHIYGVTSLFNSSTNLLCDKGVVDFTDSSISNDLITGYQWQLGDGTTSADQNPLHSYVTTGIYPIKLIVTTFNGCKDTSARVVNIKVVASPKVSIRGDSSACPPAILSFYGDINVADTSSLNWQWNFSNNISSSRQNPLPVTYLEPGAYSATMSVTNSSGCKTTQTQQVIIHPIPVVSAGNNTAVCERRTATLGATGADIYNWSPATALSCTNCATPVASPDSTITYQVEGQTIFGCKSTASVIIAVKHPFTIQVKPADTLCTGESDRLTASNAEVYSWAPSDGLDNSHAKSPTARPQQTTQYQVIGSDSIGCYYDTGYVKVIVYPFPTVDAGPDKTIAVGSSVQLNATLSADATIIQWQPAAGLSCANCANPVANPTQTTSYRILAINQGGCINKDEITIFVVCNNGNIFLPNTFSPDGNGTNDVFYPRGTGLYSIRSMRIFNRWGEPVFEATNFKANDASKGWNGSFKNKPAPNDVYVYFVEVICENNSILTYSGNITLIR